MTTFRSRARRAACDRAFRPTRAHHRNSTTSEDANGVLPGVSDSDAAKIIQGRPYTDKNQLVGKKVVSEATYEKIKDHVVAKHPKS